MSGNCVFVAFFVVINVIYVHFANLENTKKYILENKSSL